MAKSSFTIKAVTTTVGTANAAATVNVPRSGRIVAIEAAASGTGGAGVDGRITFELSTQSVSTATSNDTVNLTLSQICLASKVASAATAACNSIGPVSFPVQAGARLYINQVAAGTAFGSVVTAFTIHVEE